MSPLIRTPKGFGLGLGLKSGTQEGSIDGDFRSPIPAIWSKRGKIATLNQSYSVGELNLFQMIIVVRLQI